MKQSRERFKMSIQKKPKGSWEGQKEKLRELYDLKQKGCYLEGEEPWRTEREKKGSRGEEINMMYMYVRAKRKPQLCRLTKIKSKLFQKNNRADPVNQTTYSPCDTYPLKLFPSKTT